MSQINFPNSGGGGASQNSAFMMQLISTPRLDVTGDGTEYTVVFDSTPYDSGSNTELFKIYTCPVTGLYTFTANIEVSGITASQTQGNIRFQVNSSDATDCPLGNVSVTSNSGIICLCATNMLALSKGDQVTCNVIVFGTTKVVNVANNGHSVTYFGGYCVSEGS